MNNDNRIASDFLSAIKKYADKQKQRIESEVNEFKQTELKKAEDENIEFAYEFIQKETVRHRAAIRSELARKEQESRAELFKLRMDMTDKVFDGAKEKLLAFAKTEEYKSKLLKSAEKIAKLFSGNPCTLYVKGTDLKFADDITALFGGNAELLSDGEIKIGGIKGFCPKLCITADETLDTLLSAQREWFVINSHLKVV